MPIDFDEEQAIISLTGDILVLGFDPRQAPMNGVAWCLLQEREAGEIGRTVNPRMVDPKICLREQPGILIAAENYRSLDVIIEELISLRDALKEVEQSKPPGE
jgi:hypothetical protein